jgi:phosphotriesterase-related protein
MFHEHLTNGYASPPAPQTPGGQRPPLAASLDLVAEELRQASHDGVRAIVDANARNSAARTDDQIEFFKGLGRRVPTVHVIAAGGPFKSPYAPEVVKQSVEELTEALVRDAARQRWGAFGEIGTSMEMTADERKVLTAIAKAHVRTAVPIFTHTEHDGCASCALAQLDLLESQGVDLKHLVIGHLTDIQPGSERSDRRPRRLQSAARFSVSTRSATRCCDR